MESGGGEYTRWRLHTAESRHGGEYTWRVHMESTRVHTVESYTRPGWRSVVWHCGSRWSVAGGVWLVGSIATAPSTIFDSCRCPFGTVFLARLAPLGSPFEPGRPCGIQLIESHFLPFIIRRNGRWSEGKKSCRSQGSKDESRLPRKFRSRTCPNAPASPTSERYFPVAGEQTYYEKTR